MKLAAASIVKYINEKTRIYRQLCELYTLDSILDAMVSEPNEKLLTFKASVNDVIGRQVSFGDRASGALPIYLVTIRVLPGNGVFEVTAVYDEATGRFTVSDNISRVSLYGDASSCVHDHEMKKFCYCKT